LNSSTNFLGPIGQHTSRIHNKFIPVHLKNKNSIASFISHNCLCKEKSLIFFADGNRPDHSFCHRQVYSIVVSHTLLGQIKVVLGATLIFNLGFKGSNFIIKAGNQKLLD